MSLAARPRRASGLNPCHHLPAWRQQQFTGYDGGWVAVATGAGMRLYCRGLPAPRGLPGGLSLPAATLRRRRCRSLPLRRLAGNPPARPRVACGGIRLVRSVAAWENSALQSRLRGIRGTDCLTRYCLRGVSSPPRQEKAAPGDMRLALELLGAGVSHNGDQANLVGHLCSVWSLLQAPRLVPLAHASL